MSRSVDLTATLVRHPESRASAARSIDVRVRNDVGGTLAIAYAIVGDLARVRLPPTRTRRIVHGLWQHTCCECFIALHGSRGYHEFNLSPSGEWAAYAFSDYREGAALEDDALNPRIAVRGGDDRIEIDGAIPLGRLSATHASTALLLAFSAVIEDTDGALSYWALRHPPGRPDFHHRDSFILEIEGL